MGAISLRIAYHRVPLGAGGGGGGGGGRALKSVPTSLRHTIRTRSNFFRVLLAGLPGQWKLGEIGGR